MHPALTVFIILYLLLGMFLAFINLIEASHLAYEARPTITWKTLIIWVLTSPLVLFINLITNEENSD